MDLSDDVRSRDFLHRHARTPLREAYLAAGVPCEIATNSELLLKLAGASFRQNVEQGNRRSSGLSLRFWVDESDMARSPWPSPYVRGVGHLVYAGFGSKNSFIADLLTRRVAGRFSAAMVSDSRYWRSTIFPMLMSIVAGSLGLVEVHSACVARGGNGLLLIGAGRSGKSTQAVALMRLGFRALSDDRTFCSIREGKLVSYGLPRPIKLREDAGSWFEEFQGRKPRDVQNGEAVFLSESNSTEAHESLEPCEPRAIVFLERNGEGCRISRMKRSDVRSRIEADLLPETAEAVKDQQCVIEALSSLPCWHLQYGARPEVIAEQIARLLPRDTKLNTDHQ